MLAVWQLFRDPSLNLVEVDGKPAVSGDSSWGWHERAESVLQYPEWSPPLASRREYQCPISGPAGACA
jgi:hypothetical protein